MTRKLLCRIASGLLFFFAAAHTMGTFKDRQPTPEATAVREAMNTVHFDIMGMNRTYGDFYFGFCLMLTAYLAFSGWAAWKLGNARGGEAGLARTLLGGMAVCTGVIAAISWRWFFLPPAVVSTLATAALAAAALRKGA